MLRHLRTEVLGDTEENPRFGYAFAHIQFTKIEDFLFLDHSDWRLCIVNDNGDKFTPLELKKLLAIRQWYVTNPIGDGLNRFLELTAAKLNQFVVECLTTPTSKEADDSHVALSHTEIRTPDDVIRDFQKGIKRDISHYHEFKEDKKWTAWNRQLHSIARTHGVENVLDPVYVPISPSDIALFTEHQKFMYSVFEQKLKTAKSMKYVRRHRDTFDSQALYIELLHTYEEGVTQDINIDSIEREIHNFRLTEAWSGTLESFFTRFEHKILDLEEISKTEVNDKEKRKWLDNAIRGHTDLQGAITTSRVVQQTLSGKELTYDQYWDIILSHAKVLDEQNKKSTAGRKAKQAKTDKKKDNKPKGRQAKTANTSTDKPNSNWVPPEKWAKMTPEQKKAHIDRYKKQKNNNANRQANVANTGSTPATSSAPTPTAPTPAAPVPTPAPTEEPPGALLRQLMSNRAAVRPGQTVIATGTEVVIDGQRFRACAAKTYQVSKRHTRSSTGSLIDGGCNGGLAGSDVRVLELTEKKVNISGIGDTELAEVTIGNVAGLIQSTKGPIIAIFNQYATYGKGNTIHSAIQLRSFANTINDIPSTCPGGTQTLTTPDGYVIPLAVRDGLCYMDMRCPTDKELEELHHVIMTSDDNWEPDSFDSEPNEQYFDSHASDDEFDDWVDCDDDYGEAFSDHELNMMACIRDNTNDTYQCHMGAVKPPRKLLPKAPNYEALRPFLNFINIERIQNTLKATTQWFRLSRRLPMRHHVKSRFPAAHVNRWNEDIATDVFFSDTPAHDDGIPGHGGCTMAQLFVGIKSHFRCLYPMRSEKQFPSILQQVITDRGAPNSIRSDYAMAQRSGMVQNICRMFSIGQSYSEPYNQQQNPAERNIQEVKKDVNALMDRTGTPAEYWLLCALFVVYLSNLIAAESLTWRTPTEVAFGTIPDISAVLHFRWWEPVYYLDDDGNWPSDSKEKKGHWVGVADNVGDVLTWWVLTDDTLQVIPRSVVRTAVDPLDPNIRLNQPLIDPLDTIVQDNSTSVDGEVNGIKTVKEDFIFSIADINMPDDDPTKVKLPRFTIDELMDRTFLYPKEDGRRLRAEIVRKINDQDALNHQNIKLLCKVGDEGAEEIITYQEICDLIEEQDAEESSPDKLWTFKKVLGHKGPLKTSDPNWAGSMYNIMVLWEDDSITEEPLKLFIKDDPVTVAEYAHANGLLDTPGWKHLRHIVKNQKKYGRLLKQAKLKSYRREPIYMFGIRVPRTSHEARILDEKNGNTKWRDAEKMELVQLDDYNTFNKLGKSVKPPDGYQRIRVHFVYAVKHDLRHKARLVAGGHLTEPPKDSVYSGVVSLRSMRLALLIGEINGLTPMVGDIGNAYLEAYTKEKVYFVAGKEFGEFEGFVMIIIKALYGLRTSGARFHERLADTLRDMGFSQSYADPDLWLRDADDCYEYICVYVDDLMVIMKDPHGFFNILSEKYKYVLKGIGDPEYHLGGNFGRDPDGTLYWGARTYVEKMLSNYERMFDGLPKKYGTPLEEGDSPELDQSDLVSEEDASIYQSLIGALQWCVTLGRIDVTASVMTMASFRAAPRKGHLDRLKRIYGYLRKYPDAAIRFRTGIPPNEDHFSMPEYDWMNTVYGEVEEEIDKNLPTPKGKTVRMTTFVDANLMHCKVTGKSATGILHMINQTPIDWFSRKQPTVETATYGSEFVAARQATDQVIDLRYTLRSMGVPLEKATWLLGDNKSVVTSSTVPHSTLGKRHLALAYHRVRSAIAAGFILFGWVDGKQNPSDMMTKFLAHPKLWGFTQPLLFWRGDTFHCFQD